MKHDNSEISESCMESGILLFDFDFWNDETKPIGSTAKWMEMNFSKKKRDRANSIS